MPAGKSGQRIEAPWTAPRNTAGFTLVELLVVLAILAGATYLALPSPRAPQRSLALDAIADELKARLTEARARAIARGAPVHVDVDPAGHTYAASGDTRATPVPTDIAIMLVTARTELTARGGGRITFMPDGSATGGTIRLVSGPRAIAVSVSWLTGLATVATAP